jgi:hypothetical protein
MHVRYDVKYSLLSHFAQTSIIFDSLSKNVQISNFMEIRPVGAELFHVDRRTDGRTDRNDDGNTRSSSSQFCERRLKKCGHATKRE